MGSLDDAIREHLELKRQRGASDEEVKRQEEEAFGRGPRPAPQTAEEPATHAEPPASGLTEQDLEAAEPQSNGQPAGQAEPEQVLEPEPAFEPEPSEPDEVPAEESLEQDVTVQDTRDRPAPDWEQSPEPESGASADPLEKTPEFLEESEEDRLWFEQRPPKDFDFD
jgi:hypothetical protein